MIIKIRSVSKFTKKLERHGDWIDLPFCGILKYPCPSIPLKDYYQIHIDSKGKKWYSFGLNDWCILSLGIAAKLPEGYEAHLLPRSSLFLKHGILVGNSMGIIDNNYCGNNDVWGLVCYFTQPTRLFLGERIAQFRIVKSMGSVNIKMVDNLETKDRGGFGSTGE